LKDSLKAILAPKVEPFELGPGAAVKIKELSLKERIAWRAASVLEDGKLSDDWIAQLLFRAVQDEAGDPLWASAEEVDGSESVLGRLLEACQKANGLAADSSKEAQGN
jgi:hypothetical protein